MSGKHNLGATTCPFCGASGDRVGVMEIDVGSQAAHCEECGAIGPARPTWIGAIGAWNGDSLVGSAMMGPVSGNGRYQARTIVRTGRVL